MPTQPRLDSNNESMSSGTSTGRRSYRTRAEIPAALQRLGSGSVPAAWRPCWLRDISTSGAAIEGTLGLHRNERVRLRFGEPGGVFELLGVVTRGQEQARVFGVQFGPLGEHEANALYQLVMRLAHEYVEFRTRHSSWTPRAERPPTAETDSFLGLLDRSG